MIGQPAASVARDFQVSPKTVLKWIARFRAQAGDYDKPDQPQRGDQASGISMEEGKGNAYQFRPALSREGGRDQGNAFEPERR